MCGFQQHKCVPDCQPSINVLRKHLIIYSVHLTELFSVKIIFKTLFVCLFFLAVALDGKGRGGPDPLQVSQGEPGQRVLPATGFT